MKWIHSKKKLRDTYYPAEQSNRVYTVKKPIDVDVAALEKGLNAEVPTGLAYDAPGSLVVTYTYEPVNEGVELPAGSYSFIGGSPSSSDRLEVRTKKTSESYIAINNTDVIEKDIDVFLANKAVYEDLGVAYRRGYLIHGPPGNGKTALIHNMLSGDRFKDAQTIWCKEFPPDDFLERLNETPNLKIIILEELNNETGENNYPTSKLLEMLDGESSLQNCITIATTNYPEFLAKNLANRPSRFDLVTAITNPTKSDAMKLLSFFLKEECPDIEIDTKRISVAHIKEMVIIHKTTGMSLEEAYKKVYKQISEFQQNFQEKKSFGL